MDSNHDKVIQSHLCYRYTTRQKGGKFRYHIPAKSQMKGMTDDKSQMTDWESPATRKVGWPAESNPKTLGGGSARVLARSDPASAEKAMSLRKPSQPFEPASAKPAARQALAPPSEASPIFAICYLLSAIRYSRSLNGSAMLIHDLAGPTSDS
jgi:hypothetical protein